MNRPNIPQSFHLQHEFDDEPSFIVNMDGETVAEVPPLDGKHFNPCARAIVTMPEALDLLHAILFAAETPPGASLGEAKLCQLFKDKARTVLVAAGFQP